ncbi:helix-turn-helix domain-containing protein [Streptomyces sp. MJP52]|uniref:helix-turn-helix transcriptional regulator n=1 Tax=Streptomyces sp. MJP52 TaxID=2940555 RepID=UPI0024741A2B|nr:helix-turn-helix domain-containing protein [Streptomyces sp. MJP52]MDH6224297.1 excisionase family DNA binding protein [Streptomyces sp. MJP52]
MPNQIKPPPRGWLWSAEAADYLGVCVTTLYRWRRDGIGPACKRHGLRRYAYRITDLDAWMNGDTEDAGTETSRVAA